MMDFKVTTSFVLAVLTSVEAYTAKLETFNGCASNGVLQCQLRVRKLNRTLSALTGNVTLFVDLDDNFLTSFNGYHSPLGNNQYNLYAMKVPPITICNFMKNFWGDYYGYFVPYVPTIEKPGVCPITARYLPFNDFLLDPAMFPPFVPTGTWKLVWRATDNSTGRFFSVEAVFKVFPDKFF